ncbi:hypothetical protein E2C01_004151 [Portunus trituberculatus]|uniref:Uncharacterized protein n=1 Tax=Portunus trituberculatus TaxID=210409 RepID=A0A5B7CS97_PORTR|nr:hypothetical protein [Portunus trituberculatus]
MEHGVPSFMASCSARCHYKQGTRTHHSPPDPMQGPLTAPSWRREIRLGKRSASHGQVQRNLIPAMS